MEVRYMKVYTIYRKMANKIAAYELCDELNRNSEAIWHVKEDEIPDK